MRKIKKGDNVVVVTGPEMRVPVGSALVLGGTAAVV